MAVLAAVDIGSNSVRLKIAKLSRSRLLTLHEDREVTRLGEGVFRDGALDPAAIALTVKVLRRFRKACDRFKVTEVRVVATSATRDARNSREFADWVKRATGWRMEVISGIEEGRLIHLGLATNMRGFGEAKRVLFFDLGGGSCEITLSEAGHIRQVVSLPLGAVRLTQEFLKHDPPTVSELHRMHDYVREELVRVRNKVCERTPQLTIATSGTAAALSGAARRLQRDAKHTTQKSLAELLDLLSTRNVRQRAAVPGINAKRAEIIIAGAMVFTELLSIYDLPSFHYSPLGLRDGLLAQMAADLDEHTRGHIQIAAQREDALVQMCRRYGIDLKYANAVRSASQQLFTELRRVHGLDDSYGPLLGAAAMLHECGYYVNRKGRHRHTWYLIFHSEIFGFDEHERAVIAAAARYMGKTRPSIAASDIALAALGEAERNIVARLVALLRLSRALNQSRRAVVTAVTARTTPRSSHLRLTMRSNRVGDLELWAAQKEAAYFESTFGRKLSLERA